MDFDNFKNFLALFSKLTQTLADTTKPIFNKGPTFPKSDFTKWLLPKCAILVFKQMGLTRDKQD